MKFSHTHTCTYQSNNSLRYKFWLNIFQINQIDIKTLANKKKSTIRDVERKWHMAFWFTIQMGHYRKNIDTRNWKQTLKQLSLIKSKSAPSVVVQISLSPSLLEVKDPIRDDNFLPWEDLINFVAVSKQLSLEYTTQVWKFMFLRSVVLYTIEKNGVSEESLSSMTSLYRTH